jgi:hypothetical protein
MGARCAEARELRVDVVDHRFRLGLRLEEHFGRDVTLGDLAQRDHGHLVVVHRHRGLGAVGQAPRAGGSQQHELEQVVHVVQAVFDGNSGHVISRRMF